MNKMQIKCAPIETLMVTRIIRDAIDLGYFVNVHNGEDFQCAPCQDLQTIVNSMAKTEEDTLYFSKKRAHRDLEGVGFVDITWGAENGPITNYTNSGAIRAIVFAPWVLSDLELDC